MTNRTEIIAFIHSLSQQKFSFQQSFEQLENALDSLVVQDLSELLLDCGIIPEQFGHDTTEEKLWAKYCDILLSKTWNQLGIASQVIRARGNAADVMGKTSEYTIVGDAKAFRLSRTAKNQKDFKVDALDDWRRSNTFACLVAPLYQYPARTSQIYGQAQRKNVTLLAYVHLKFLIDNPPTTTLMPLWQASRDIATDTDALLYWQKINAIILTITNKTDADLQVAVQAEHQRIIIVGQSSLDYWQSVINQYQSLPREEAIQRLIKAEKIEQKISSIQKTMRMIQADDE